MTKSLKQQTTKHCDEMCELVADITFYTHALSGILTQEITVSDDLIRGVERLNYHIRQSSKKQKDLALNIHRNIPKDIIND